MTKLARWNQKNIPVDVQIVARQLARQSWDIHVEAGQKSADGTK